MKKTLILLVMLVFLLMVIVGDVTALYQPPADRVPASGDWSNAGVPGDIPHRTTICATLSPTGDSTDRTSDIQSALNSCGTNEVVYLNAGTYYVSSGINIPSNTVLRGAGIDQTWLRKTGSSKNVIRIGAGQTWANPGCCGIQGYLYDDYDYLTGGYTKDSDTVSMADTTGWSVGDMAIISQQDGTNLGEHPGCNPDMIGAHITGSNPVNWDHFEATGSWIDWPNGDDGTVGQISLVKAVTATTIQLEDPLYYTYRSGCEPMLVRTSVAATNAGVEDLSIYRTETGSLANDDSDGTVVLARATYSWVKNVKLHKALGPGITLPMSYKCTVHGSMATRAWSYTSGGGGYQFKAGFFGSNNLWENNIIHQGTPNFHVQTGSGNVFAYNYMDVAVTNGGTEWAVYNIAGHAIGSHMNLFEGNQISIMADDNIYGNDFTWFHFRNHYDTKQTEWVDDSPSACVGPGDPYPLCTGAGTGTLPDMGCCDSSMATDNRAALDFDNQAIRWSVVGNVLGMEGESYSGYQTDIHGGSAAYIYRQPTNVLDSLLRHGNYDYYYNAVKWCSEGDPEADCQGGDSDQDLPKSLYLTEKPSWWDEQGAGRPWPPIGPDVSGYVVDIPAKDRFEGEVYIPKEVCNNSIIEGSELCDGTDLGGETCESQGFSGGTLACLPDCSGFDTSACTSDLGNTYYVSDSSCSDNNPGTNPSQPWCHCPGMLGWSGSATLNAGDTVYFDRDSVWNDHDPNDFYAYLKVKGGVSYIGDEWEQDGGTTSTRAKIDIPISAGFPEYFFGVIAFHGPVTVNDIASGWNYDGSDHPTLPTLVKGFELDGNNAEANPVGFNDPVFQGSGSNEDCTNNMSLAGAAKRVENLYIHDFEGREDTDGQYRYGIRVNNYCGSNAVIENVEIVDNIIDNVPRSCIAVYPQDTYNDCKVKHVFVRGNTISNCTNNPNDSGNSPKGKYRYTHGITVKGYVEDCYIENNYVYGFEAHPAIGDNEGSHIFINDPEDGNGPGPKNIHIRYNILHDQDSYDSENGVIRIYGPENKDKSVYVYGNILYGRGNGNDINGQHGIYVDGNGGDLDLLIFGNTFYDTDVYFDDTGTISSLEVRNNIFYSTDTYGIYDPNGKISAHSNNLFYRVGGGDLIYSGGNTYTSSNIDSYEPSAVADDPLFKDSSSLPTGFVGSHGFDLRPNTNGLSLQAGSPAIDNGALLGAIYSYSINSISRPKGSGWDIGAYEYIPAGPECIHQADNNPCDGCITMQELSAFIGLWYQGNSSMLELIEAISLWKSGAGCQ